MIGEKKEKNRKSESGAFVWSPCREMGERRGFCLKVLYYLNLCVLPYFHALGADLDARAISKRCPLKIWVFALVSRRVVLGRADAVRVVTYNDCAFITGWTDFCHICIS